MDTWLSSTLRDQPELLQQDTNGFWRTKAGKLVIPSYTLREEVMRAAHDSVFSGHLGVRKTLDLLQRQFWWVGMKQTVAKFIRSCDHCQRNKSLTAKPLGALQPLQLPLGKWSSISVDFITELPETATTQYTAICVFVDRLTKMVHLVPTVEQPDCRRVRTIVR